jgi:hypothetical protein
MTTRAEQVAKELLEGGFIVMRLPMRETLLEFAATAYRRALEDVRKDLADMASNPKWSVNDYALEAIEAAMKLVKTRTDEEVTDHA